MQPRSMAMIAALLPFAPLATAQVPEATKAVTESGASAVRTQRDADAVEDLQKILLEVLKLDGPRGVGSGSPEHEALRDLAVELAGSKVFVDEIKRAAKPWMSREDFMAELAAGAYQAGYAGIVVLQKEDVEFVLRMNLRLMSGMGSRECARAAEFFQLHEGEASGQERLTPADFARVLAITRTVYLAGLAKQPGAPMPPAGSVAEARIDALHSVPENERGIATAFATDARKLDDAETCRAALAYRKAAVTLEGDAGDALRRSIVVEGIRKAMVARANASVPVTGSYAPGPAGLRYPDMARRAKIQGQMLVRIWIDDQGSVTDARVMERKFTQPSITRNGTVITVADLFDPPTLAHFCAAKFTPMTKVGNAVPFVGEVWVSFTY